MAASLNKVQLIGNIGAAVESRAAGESTVASFSLATTDRWKDRESGERKERTEWHTIEVWGGLAGIVSQFGRKGGLVYVEGKTRTDKYTDGQGVERYKTKVRADEVIFLDREEKKGAGVALNMIQLIGHLGSAPQLRDANGIPVVSFNVATTESWKDRRTQERMEHTEWLRVEAWEGLAEIVGQFGRKGGLVYAEGALRTEKYTDNDGIERYTTKVRATTLKFLDRAPSDDAHGGDQPADHPAAQHQDDADDQREGDGRSGGEAPASAPAAAATPDTGSTATAAPRKPYDRNRFRNNKAPATA